MGIILLLLSILFVSLGIWFKKTRINHTREFVEADGKSPAMLGSLNSFGTTMLGRFTYKNGVEISYYCLTILWCPIIPLGCYACEEVIDDDINTTKYRFYGRQPWKIEEVLQLYSRWFWLLGTFALLWIFV